LLKPATAVWRLPTAVAKIGSMPAAPMSHPDRAAATLANLPDATAARGAGPFRLPGAGAHDARLDLKLLLWRALAAAARSPRAKAHLDALGAAAHPDLWAGTVQDGTARGFAARLEEVIALAPPLPAPAPALATRPDARITTGKELRKRKDLLVASNGSRVRFTRKEGLLFVDRDGGLHSSNCLRFEARTDLGSLDGFVAAADERPRLFSAQFLQARHHVDCDGISELLLQGRLGRGPIGWNVELLVTGDPQHDRVRLQFVIGSVVPGWRLRARFLGLPLAAIEHECTPVHEVVASDGGGFVAFTLVRACAQLLVDDAPIAVPAAAAPGPLRHVFWLGTVVR
jgi:hypothetical protein